MRLHQGQAGVLVEVTSAMERAGLLKLRELDRTDESYLVRSIYMAMEYERLEALGESSNDFRSAAFSRVVTNTNP